MIRVLQCVNNMHRAGLETMLMNYYRHIDRATLQFDFLTHRPFRSEYDDEIESLGGKIYRAPRLMPQNYPAYFRYMRNFFAQHAEYRIVHSHIDSMSYLPLAAAQKAGVPVRIAHSHNTSIDLDYKYPLKQYFRWRLPAVATHRLACGMDAGRYLFGNRDFEVIANAVEPARFVSDAAKRERIRETLGISNRFVIGHVGRFCRQKNQGFLVDIFAQIVRTEPDAVLLLVGIGECEAAVRKQVQNAGLQSKVLFLGNRDDVADLYSAMDILVMPSLFEGLPLVGIEAQMAGLPCIFSDAVPREVLIGADSERLSLKTDAAQWAVHILRRKGTTRISPPAQTLKRYDIAVTAKELQRMYTELILTI